MPSWFPAELLLFFVGILAGYAGSFLQNWFLHRRTYSLECAVSDLEAKLLIEIKRRAGHERQSQKSLDREILDAAKSVDPAKPPAPWWTTVPGPRSFNG